MKEKILSGIFGLCVADAIGVPVEFQSRESLKRSPVVDMRGYGSYDQPPGTWSDDTSMTLALLDSLAYGLDYDDIMQRFLSWLDETKYTPYDEVFDVGKTSREAITRFAKGTSPVLCGGSSEYDNGNGSLMRILPLVFYLHTNYGEDYWGNADAVAIIHNISALTHAHNRSRIACGFYLSIAEMLMGGIKLDMAISLGIYRAKKHYEKNNEYSSELKHFERLHQKEFQALPENQIKSSGYVVDTLEAAVWCLLNTDSYESCVLKAVNLGEDTDTVAAVAGGLAGMYYGIHAIPTRWREQIPRADYITELCNAYDASLQKAGFDKIKDYIHYFETAKAEDAYGWQKSQKLDNGSFTMPYPIYDKKLEQFAVDVSNSGLMDYSYPATIERYGGNLSHDLKDKIETADLDFTKAILTCYIRQERFCDGIWGTAVRDGIFLALLRRLTLLFEGEST